MLTMTTGDEDWGERADNDDEQDENDDNDDVDDNKI